MPLIPCSKRLFNQRSPLIWYSFKVPWKDTGVPTNSNEPWSTDEKSSFYYFFLSNFYKLSILLVIIWLTVRSAASSSISTVLSPSIFPSYLRCSASTPNLVAIKWEYSYDWWIIYCNLFYCFFAYCYSSSRFFNSVSNLYFFFFSYVSSFYRLRQYIKHYRCNFFALLT